MEYHKLSNLFPMMSVEEFAELKADIKHNGFDESHPVWIYEGQILDGRNRLKACEELGINPIFKTYEGDNPLMFVIRENLHRRHLTTGQRAALALEILPFVEEEAKKRMIAGIKPDPTENLPQGESRELVGNQLNVSGRSVSEIKKIRDEAPEEFEAIKRGEKTINEVKKKIDLENRKKEILSQTKKIINKPKIWLSDYSEWLINQPKCDLLLTDPPYMTDVENISLFVQQWLSIGLSKVKNTGRAYIFIGSYPQELNAYLDYSLNFLSNPNIKLEQILVWTYRNTLGPTPKDKYKQNWQAVLYFKGSMAADLNSPVMTEQFSVQDINAPDGRIGDRYHEWQKPLEIGERFIRHSTKAGDIVLDPFACTGTFILAANKLGRDGRGCDISAENIKIAEERGCELQK